VCQSVFAPQYTFVLLLCVAVWVRWWWLGQYGLRSEQWCRLDMWRRLGGPCAWPYRDMPQTSWASSTWRLPAGVDAAARFSGWQSRGCLMSFGSVGIRESCLQGCLFIQTCRGKLLPPSSWFLLHSSKYCGITDRLTLRTQCLSYSNDLSRWVQHPRQVNA